MLWGYSESCSDVQKGWVNEHLYGVSLAATMIAKKRGMDSELASIPMDEVLKDADVIHHCMNDLSKAIKEKDPRMVTQLAHAG